MDCYIVRVYRHITHQDGQADEIAGLVEQVGEEARSKPFSSYTGLVEAIRESVDMDAAPGLNSVHGGEVRAIHSVRGRQ